MLDALYAAVHPMAAKHYHAFFSTELGGIVTDPALMFIHADDHMVHRCRVLHSVACQSARDKSSHWEEHYITPRCPQG